mmetsp:Transcript_113408/g.177259  ORF Transcript_113408/g.177259 Transcript_113408/m.177259 type:complete len:159 (-) Transcript_113408:148-624(-)
MGVSESTGIQTCSVTKPGGYDDEMPGCMPEPSKPTQAGGFSSCTLNGDDPNLSRTMDFSSIDQVNKDKISPWARNQTKGQCHNMLSCGVNGPPIGRIAETADGGVLVFDSRDFPIWLDDEEGDSRVVGLDPMEQCQRPALDKHGCREKNAPTRSNVIK